MISDVLYHPHPKNRSSSLREPAVIIASEGVTNAMMLALAFSAQRAREGHPAVLVLANFSEWSWKPGDTTDRWDGQVWRELDGEALLGATWENSSTNFANRYLTNLDEALENLCIQGEEAELKCVRASGIAELEAWLYRDGPPPTSHHRETPDG